MTRSWEDEAGASAGWPWQVHWGPEGLAVSHALLALTLAGWHGELGYRVGSREFREPLNLRLMRSAQVENRRIWLATGAHLNLPAQAPRFASFAFGALNAMVSRGSRDLSLVRPQWRHFIENGQYSVRSR